MKNISPDGLLDHEITCRWKQFVFVPFDCTVDCTVLQLPVELCTDEAWKPKVLAFI